MQERLAEAAAEHVVYADLDDPAESGDRPLGQGLRDDRAPQVRPVAIEVRRAPNRLVRPSFS